MSSEPAKKPAPPAVSSAIYAVRWLIHDTFRQAWATGIMGLMLAVTALCVFLCLSVSVHGTQLDRSEGNPEFLPSKDPAALDKNKAAANGVTVVDGEVSLAFGVIRMPVARDAVDVVRFIQCLLALGVADAGGLLLILIWTAGFLPTFLEPSSASVMLAKPVPRWSLLLGKFLGVLSFVGVMAVLFVTGTWLALGLATGIWDVNYFWVIPMLLVHFTVFYSFSALLAVMTRSTVACVFGSVLFWMLCWAMNYGRHMVVAISGLDSMAGSMSVALEAGYWFLPKPVDMGILLVDALNAGSFFVPVLEYQRVQAMGAFHPEWSIVSSLGFAALLLGLAAYEFVTTDY
jgi:hypothetical protein